MSLLAVRCDDANNKTQTFTRQRSISNYMYTSYEPHLLSCVTAPLGCAGCNLLIDGIRIAVRTSFISAIVNFRLNRVANIGTKE